MKTVKLSVQKNEDKLYPFVWNNDEDKDFFISAELKGDNASLTLLGVFLGTGNHSVNFHTDVTHTGQHTKSLTLIRTVLLDRASFNNDGMVRIKKGAKNTNGYFDSKILLFDNAKGRSVPSLEIDENEVKAGHGSTIGRPDEDQLFYLRSRGMSEKEAEQLLIEGFFDPIIKLLPDREKYIAQKKMRINFQDENI